MTRPALFICLLMLTLPLTGSLSSPTPVGYSEFEGGASGQLLRTGDLTEVPNQIPRVNTQTGAWWTHSNLDQNGDGIHDSLLTVTGPVGIGLSYDHTPDESDVAALNSLGLSVNDVIESVDALLLGEVDASLAPTLAGLDGVVMVERYGKVVFYGDVQTMAVKARNSSVYNDSAWQLGVSGAGVNIALTDTGVDNEHPGLDGKFVAGFDAVCYLHSDVPRCIAAGFGAREDDGSFDPDDGNQHGTACMGMASATGLEADGSQSEFYGSAPNATLVDVRIGTDVGAGPFENYLTEQEAYESAMNGIQWIIDNNDTAWPGVDESLHGIDIISLSWGITSHEAGGSDGDEMHSRLLDEAVLAGITPSVAAGNDGPDNDGLSGMGSSSLSITVGATDDINTVERSDDTIAGYSSRGPRRDNGDSNPLNELKPEISAPGTNIIQAEGCVTSGACNNNIPGQDAADNTYTGRGSGTSYATPAVTGIIALVMEANPDLSPLTIKEVLKQTAERRGEPSAVDIDPYWNRDFGWGMVDARAAVELALQLNSSGIMDENLDLAMQNHLLDVNTTGDILTITGHAWAQQGLVNAVEFRVGQGDWSETTYETPPEELVEGQPFNWTIVLDLGKIGVGNQSIEIRAVGDSGQSLPVYVTASGMGSGVSAGAGDSLMFILSLALLVSIVGVHTFYSKHSEGQLNLPFASAREANTEVRSEDGEEGVLVAELASAEGS